MNRKKKSEIGYYTKVGSDEENKIKIKNKNKKNNCNNFQKSYQKSNQKSLNPKKIKFDVNNFEKYKSKKSSGQINDDSSPTKETMHSPSNYKKKANEKTKSKSKSKEKEEKEKEKENKKLKNKNKIDIKETPKKHKNEETEGKNNNKFDTFESVTITKNENEDELVTSFERKPSELKSPHTISDDSFTSSYEDENSNLDKKEYEEKNKKNNDKNIEKNKKKINEIINRDCQTYSELADNELIYVDKINYNKDEDEEEKLIDIKDTNKKEKNKNEIKNSNKKNQGNNLKIPKLDLDENNLNEKEKVKEKELKEKEREKERNKKIEKLKNIEINTKMTTRHAKYMNNNNNHKINCKIIVNKSPRDVKMKTERDSSTPKINTAIIISHKKLDEKIPYIPVNQRKKLTVNKKLIDSFKIKDLTKTKSLNFNDSDIPKMETIKKNDKDKIFLSNFKKSERKIIGFTKTNTEEKNRYKKKYLNGNNLKDNYFNLNKNKTSLENIRYKASVSNRKHRDTKSYLEKQVSHTIEVSDENINKKRNKNDSQNNKNNTKEKIKNGNNEFYRKKNTVLITTNNKLGINLDNLRMSNKNTQSTNIIPKKISYHTNSKKIIYEPKKLGVIKVRSTEKSNSTPFYNNMSYDPNQYLKNKLKDAFYSGNKQKTNNLNNTLNDMNNNNIIENNLFKKTENIQKKIIGLSNMDAEVEQINQYNNKGLLNNTIVNGLNNVNNLNSKLNSSYDIGKIENFRTNNNYFIKNNNNNKVNNNSFISNKLNDKNNSASNLINLLSQKERYSLYNYYDIETKSNNNNNLALNNMQDNSLFHHNNSYDIGVNEQMKTVNNQTQLINLIGNNFLGPNIVQNNPINNSIGNINNIDLQSIIPNNFNLEQNNFLSINFEDLIILQEYLKKIIISLNKNKVIENECFEFWNYYYNSSICCQLDKLFPNPLDSNAVRISINYTLMSIILCYDYSFENELLNKCYTTLYDILKLSYKNLMLICEHILSKITKESLTNIWVLKLSIIVNASNFNDYNQFLLNGYNMTIVERISYNTNIIVQNLRFLLKNFKSNKNDILTSIFKKIREKTYEEINTFFREKILRITNINGSILASVFLLKNNNFRTLPAPYVRTKNNKEFSLVLDLDETLINFKPRDNGEDGGVLRVRPGITEFLEEVGKYYELIIFTTATQDYADVLIDEIEEDKIYFDHRLYREHAVIIDNDFVKDLTRIGRPLDKIIIVDNMPQNFRLQKENGIIIKAFWGEDNYDTALIDLYPILVNIAKEGGDVRKSLVKYRDEIVKNVTSCISKNDM